LRPAEDVADAGGVDDDLLVVLVTTVCIGGIQRLLETGAAAPLTLSPSGADPASTQSSAARSTTSCVAQRHETADGEVSA
jgi:hypothetical protein